MIWWSWTRPPASLFGLKSGSPHLDRAAHGHEQHHGFYHLAQRQHRLARGCVISMERDPVRARERITATISPVIGPQTLVRNSTVHAAGSIVEDAIAFTDMDGVNMGSVDAAGATVFTFSPASIHSQAQCVPMSPANSIPVMISVRENRLRVDIMTRTGFGSAFHVGATHPAGLHWAAARKTLLYSVATDGTTLHQHRLSSGTNAGWWQARRARQHHGAHAAGYRAHAGHRAVERCHRGESR